jgi:hypothetical protein
MNSDYPIIAKQEKARVLFGIIIFLVFMYKDSKEENGYDISPNISNLQPT